MAYLTNPLSDAQIKKAKLKEKDCSYFYKRFTNTSITKRTKPCRLQSLVLDFMWGSDNICIRKKKKIGGKKLAEAPVCGALAFLEVGFMQKWKMVGIGGKWSKIGFYFA